MTNKTTSDWARYMDSERTGPEVVARIGLDDVAHDTGMTIAEIKSTLASRASDGDCLTVTASNPRPSTCCTTTGAVDVDVHCSIPGQAGHMLPLPTGSVTVAPRQSDGRLAGYGPTPEHWITGALLAQLRRLSGLDLDTALDDILTAAVDAAADPLRGYSADEMVVGPGGQTLAEAAAAAPDLEPGWEDRAVERARRDGVLPEPE